MFILDTLSLTLPKHLAILLTLLFVLELVMQMDFIVLTVSATRKIKFNVFQVYNTLIVDGNHGRPSAAQSSSNVIRCTLAAIMMAFAKQLVDTTGSG